MKKTLEEMWKAFILSGFLSLTNILININYIQTFAKWVHKILIKPHHCQNKENHSYFKSGVCGDFPTLVPHSDVFHITHQRLVFQSWWREQL